MAVSHTGISSEYLRSVRSRFQDAKDYAEKTFMQLEDEHLLWYPNEESNSIAVIVKHMSGNMVSRWTDIFETDGEKPGRNRDGEFEHTIRNREELFEVWNRGWDVFFQTLDSLTEDDLTRQIFIRNETHTVLDAIDRQLYHYSYHIGQMVYIAKMLKAGDWKTLTIPRKI